MALVHYDEGLTMREARALYFEVNRFGADGGYGDAWVDFKLGPLPVPFPNTRARVRAVRYHDLHHVLTGYDTNAIGEFEIRPGSSAPAARASWPPGSSTWAASSRGCCRPRAGRSARSSAAAAARACMAGRSRRCSIERSGSCAGRCASMSALRPVPARRRSTCCRSRSRASRGWWSASSGSRPCSSWHRSGS